MVTPTTAAPALAVGPLAPRFEDVERIAVLRGGGLGDLLFALPAVEALAAAYPAARITLLGTPLHADLLAGRPGPVAGVEVLPLARGVRESPGREEDPAGTDRFLDRLAARQFDLAVQVHGGGRFSNPFLLRLGARHTVGTRTPDAAALERTIPYRYYQHEVLRALEVVGLAGAPPVMLEPRVTVTEAERAGARELRAPGAPALLVVHPGATDARRRWPPARFADVAAAAAAAGAQVVVVGAGEDVPAAEEIVDRARAALPPAARSRVTSRAGRLTLPGLTGLLAEADVLLGNDSGPRHLAQAVGAATVGVYWFGNVINAGPLGRARHRVHLGWMTTCPVCGRDVTSETAPRCEHEDSFVADIGVEPVRADVLDLLAAPSGGVGPW
ncbi:glycosyltransferase family 9 protein [Georgenia thermotolerans]|uniref:Glycosyltransferase family 9 protein n=1 Tax=Georgenia thermotolerans TaxID=527326 RepID=A0A7J5UTM3_9MICO|nr:glycosyltransferase family 9 protein [Georgenia thermotolerans]KAE8765641.1 glycosyltransferase family 9 protein [Georgenia thermotolerans]